MSEIRMTAFLTEIAFQCRAALRSIQFFDYALQRADSAAVHDFAADFLNHAAIVSKILNPSDQTAIERGDEIRTVLDALDFNPILDPKLRNHFEQIDERIERWGATAQDNGVTVIEKSISGGNGLGIDGVGRERATIRNYDAASGLYSVFGEKYSLQQVADALLEIANRASTKLSALSY